MKKIILIIPLLIYFSYSFAQKSSVIIDLVYRTKMESSNWGIGGQYKYNLPYNFRAAADIMAYIPEDSNLGLDAVLNLQYNLIIFEKIGINPSVGVIISNHSFSADPENRKVSDFGLSIGGSAEYNLSRRNFINIDYKYFLINKDKPYWYRDYSTIKIGYGFRF